MAEEETEILYPCGCCCERCFHRRAGDGNCLFHIYAPEMYEALKWTMARVQVLRFSSSDGKWQCDVCPAMPQYSKKDFTHLPDCIYANAKAFLKEIDNG